MPDKVVIITGASSGFGQLAALEAASKGYRVVVTARRAERLHELVREITAAGGTAIAIPGDITDGDDQQRLIDTTLEHFGTLDVLVNNAGVPLPNGFADSALDDLQRQWHTNTTSLIELTKRALPALIRSRGIVINVSSSISRFSVPGNGLYASTKVAATSISDALRRELVPLGVRVAIVEPGPYATEFFDRAGVERQEQRALPPEQVSRAIVRLMARPRRMTVLPWWLHPLLLLGSGLVRLLPDLVDRVFWAMARREQRHKRTQPQPEVRV